jgi:hypothetical protein
MQISDEQKEALKGLITFAAIFLSALIVPVLVLVGVLLTFPEFD